MKIKSALYWLASQTAYGLALYFGLVHGVEGFANVACFYSWAMFVLAVLALVAYKHDTLKIDPPAMPGWLRRAAALAGVLTWAWFGWWFTAIAWALANLISAAVRADAAKATKPVPASDST